MSRFLKKWCASEWMIARTPSTTRSPRMPVTPSISAPAPASLSMKTRVLVVAALVTAQMACGGDSPTEPSEPILHIEAVSPLQLTGTVATPVTMSPTVRVTDVNGSPLGGIRVAFTVTGGDGTASAPMVETGVDGNASVGWRLGSRATLNTISVKAGTLEPVVFTATGVAGPLARITRAAGDNQFGMAGSVLNSPLTA